MSLSYIKYIFWVQVHFNSSYLSHKLLGSEDEFMVDEPSGLLFKQTAVRMDHDRLLVFDRLVMASLTEAGRVVEEPCRHCLESNT